MSPVWKRELLVLQEVSKHFSSAGSLFSLGGKQNSNVTIAVDKVNLIIHENEAIALVGESGCGKTTLARMLLRLLSCTSGTIQFNKKNIADFKGESLQYFRSQVRMIFQNQDAIFNPYMNVSRNFYKALKMVGTPKEKYREVATNLLKLVRLNSSILDRYPNQLSGGEKRRISIARAFAGSPRVIVGDEPLASLDVFTQNVVIDLLKELRTQRRFSMIFITHDLKRIAELTDRIAIMHKGRLVEISYSQEPVRHPYAKNLVRASNLEPVDENEAGKIVLTDRKGCLYRDLCPLYRKSNQPQICSQKIPELNPIVRLSNHLVACHLLPVI